jgi:hypothetical protein
MHTEKDINHGFTQSSGAATKTNVAARERIDRKEFDRRLRAGVANTEYTDIKQDRHRRNDRIMTR